MTTQEGKVVKSPKIARKLLKSGNVITDIKPDKHDKDKTVFVFQNTEKLMKELNETVEEIRKMKEERSNATTTTDTEVKTEMA